MADTAAPPAADAPAPAADAPAAAATPAAPVAPAAPAAPVSAKTMQITRSALAAQLKAGSERALSALAKDLGYESVDEMRKAAKKAPAAADAKPADVADPAKAAAADQQEMAKRLAEMERKAKRGERTAKQLEVEKQRLEAEMDLRDVARDAGIVGIKNVKYALHLLREDLAGKTSEELAAFDEVKFFAGLKAEYPQMFGVREAPADTGNSGENRPPAPKATDAAKDAAAKGKIDYRTAPAAEVDAYIRRLGINPNVH